MNSCDEGERSHCIDGTYSLYSLVGAFFLCFACCDGPELILLQAPSQVSEVTSDTGGLRGVKAAAPNYSHMVVPNPT